MNKSINIIDLGFSFLCIKSHLDIRSIIDTCACFKFSHSVCKRKCNFATVPVANEGDTKNPKELEKNEETCLTAESIG